MGRIRSVLGILVLAVMLIALPALLPVQAAPFLQQTSASTPVPSVDRVPGGSTRSATVQRPRGWIPDNAPANADYTYADRCLWDIPSGTELVRDGKEHKLTNCLSFNLFPKSTLSVNWTYGAWRYHNGQLNRTITHDTYQFLLWNWGSQTGTPRHEGIGWWGPVRNTSYAKVTYHTNRGEVTCDRVTSFEVVNDVRMTVQFVNESNDLSAVWSQGAWGEATGRGIYPPECRAPSR